MYWKALYVAPKWEKKIAARLLEKGLESYLPLKMERKQWSDRKKNVITPLINGYVFVKLNPQQRDQVFYVEGVLQYVRFNGTDAMIRDVEIEALKSIEAKGYHVEINKSGAFTEGEMVNISHGPFKGLTGIVEHHKSENVCTINITGMGYSLKIRLPHEILNKAH